MLENTRRKSIFNPLQVFQVKQNLYILCCYSITKPVNSKNNQFPSDKNDVKPDDNGGKAKLRKKDKEYHAKEPHGGDIAKKHEKEEQPVYPVKDAPKKL